MDATESTLLGLRSHAIAHSLFSPASLPDAIERLGFVQADPIRAPATAQDLILRQRVIGWVNAKVTGRNLQVELGFAGKRPKERGFAEEVEAEAARLEVFLQAEQRATLERDSSSCR